MRVIPLGRKPLPLTSDGALELFFLGVGSAFTKRHYQTNLLVRKGQDHLMVDFGTKAGQAAFELGRRVTDFRAFLITHSHADHVGGLEEVALSGRYVTRTKPVMHITAEYQRLLWSSTLRGGCGLNEAPALRFSDFFAVERPTLLRGMPRETYACRAGGIGIKMFRTGHIPEGVPGWRQSTWSTGIIIDDRVMFTSDTRIDRELLESYDRLFHPEAIFHDCQLYTGGVHASLEELLTLPLRLRRKIVLVHYGDGWESAEPAVAAGGFMGFGQQHVTYRF
jgi:phosphoribosyl 1,2-cyclic phosphodiesterase